MIAARGSQRADVHRTGIARRFAFGDEGGHVTFRLSMIVRMRLTPLMCVQYEKVSRLLVPVSPT